MELQIPGSSASTSGLQFIQAGSRKGHLRQHWSFFIIASAGVPTWEPARRRLLPSPCGMMRGTLQVGFYDCPPAGSFGQLGGRPGTPAIPDGATGDDVGSRFWR